MRSSPRVARDASATGRARASERLLRRFRRVLVAVAIGCSAVSCSPDIPSEPETAGIRYFELTGSWVYTASGVRRAGSEGDAPCAIQQMTLTLEKVKGLRDFSGRTSGGRFVCSGELAFLSGPLVPYAVTAGTTFNQFVSFNIGSPDWRHHGIVVTTDSVNIDSMAGKFTLRNAGIVFEGDFRLVR